MFYKELFCNQGVLNAKMDRLFIGGASDMHSGKMHFKIQDSFRAFDF